MPPAKGGKWMSHQQQFTRTDDDDAAASRATILV